MARGGIAVARVSPNDEQTLAPLWIAARIEAGQSAGWAERAVGEGRIRNAIQRDDVALFLATDDGAPIGYIAATRAPLSGLGDDSAVWIDQIYVTPGARRRGVAQALLSAVAGYADLVSAQQVVSCVPTGERRVNRYFARLGFTAQVTARATSVRALHRRIGGGETDTTEALVRRRMSLRENGRRPLRPMAE